jgi:hypothetical protein
MPRAGCLPRLFQSCVKTRDADASNVASPAPWPPRSARGSPGLPPPSSSPNGSGVARTAGFTCLSAPEGPSSGWFCGVRGSTAPPAPPADTEAAGQTTAQPTASTSQIDDLSWWEGPITHHPLAGQARPTESTKGRPCRWPRRRSRTSPAAAPPPSGGSRQEDAQLRQRHTTTGSLQAQTRRAAGQSLIISNAVRQETPYEYTGTGHEVKGT